MKSFIANADPEPVGNGGLEQWLHIGGEDRANPVSHWLHGKPGSDQMPVHHACSKEPE